MNNVTIKKDRGQWKYRLYDDDSFLLPVIDWQWGPHNLEECKAQVIARFGPIAKLQIVNPED